MAGELSDYIAALERRAEVAEALLECIANDVEAVANGIVLTPLDRYVSEYTDVSYISVDVVLRMLRDYPGWAKDYHTGDSRDRP